MRARVANLSALLSDDAVYQTPFFQRPYRWRERNWAAFWNGWARAAGVGLSEELLAEADPTQASIDDLGALEGPAELGPDDGDETPIEWSEDDLGQGAATDAESDVQTGPVADEEGTAPAPRRALRQKHFLGAVVLQRAPGSSGHGPRRLDILDGQQRLLTACAAIRALAIAADGLGAAETAQRLRRMLHAPDGVGGPLAARVAASRASAEDQSTAMTATVPALAAAAARFVEAPDSVALQTATHFMLRGIEATLAEGDAGRSLSELVAGLVERTELVVIEIDADMSAFDVFETLNNLGEPLSTLDLVKNRLFDFAGQDRIGETGETRGPDGLLRLYERHWTVLDDPKTLDFWGERVARGGDRRLNQDWFLRGYLSARIGREIRSDEIQDELAQMLEGGRTDGAQHIAEIGRAAEAFLEIGGHAEPDRHADRIAALRLYGNFATEPALIAVRMHLWDDAEATEAVLDMLESVVVRRFFTKAEGSGYDVFAKIAGAMGPGAAGRGEQAVEDVRKRLKAAQRGRFWPSDREFRKGFSTRELVARGGATLKRNGKPIFFNVYEKLDAEARASGGHPLPRSEQFDRTDLSVEHLYPLRGRKHWAQPKRTEAVWLRTIGNLAAIPAELNARLGQWAWEDKRAELQESTDIHLNRLICTDPRWAAWTVKNIRQRGDDLANLAIRVWRRPA